MDKPINVTPLKLARILAGKRANECAAVLGKFPSQYSLMENGRSYVRVGDAIRLSKFLDVPVEKLFGKGSNGGKG